jgi:AmiR/NasT family two-component response regulator
MGSKNHVTFCERAENLQRALRNSRDIGMAMGVLMAQNKVSRQQAFERR